MGSPRANESGAPPRPAASHARGGAELSFAMAAAAAAGFVLGRRGSGAGGSLLLGLVLVLVAALVVCWLLQRRVTRRLSTAATLLDALRHGDYAHRARAGAVRGPLAALLVEVNELADHLERERLRGQETQALLNALIERIDVALLAFDAAGRLVWWNPAAKVLLRARLEQGTPAETLCPEGLLSGATERSITLAGQSEPFELRRGVFHQAGARYHFVLLSSERRLRRQEERAAWQRLVRVLGHEVNSTLTPIQSLAGTCLSLLAESAPGVPPEPALTSRLERALLAIEHRARGLARFIADYARLARLPEPRVERVQLSACLGRLIALDERCPVMLTGKSPVEVLADPVLLDQALSNLLRNAVDASAETGGTVSVDWQSSEQEVVLSIADDGAGILNPDNLFVPLFSTKKGGSGIGLVLARNIIEAHGGQLRLANRSRAPGAVARVTLPRAPLAGPVGSAAVSPGVAGSGADSVSAR
jgi:two-component system nitrogen regulation sensor histidine kinase NtrY